MVLDLLDIKASQAASMTDGGSYIVLNYSSAPCDLDADVYDNALRMWHVEVCREHVDRDGAQVIGTARVYSLDLARGLNEAIDWRDVADAESADALHVAWELFDGAGLKDAVVDGFDLEPWTLIVIDHMALVPNERGRRLGPQIARHIVRTLGTQGSSLVAVFPQPDGWADMDKASLHAARSKIELAWASAGFKRFENGVWLMSYSDVSEAREGRD